MISIVSTMEPRTQSQCAPDATSISDKLKVFFSHAMSKGLTSRRVRKRPTPLAVEESSLACEHLPTCQDSRALKRSRTPTGDLRCNIDTSPTSPAHLVVLRDRRFANASCSTRLFCEQQQTTDDDVYPSCKGQRLSSTDTYTACHNALSIPEVVENIVRMLDNHLWQSRTSLSARKPPVADIKESTTAEFSGALSSCLYVNRTFHWAASRVMSRRVEVGQIGHLQAYATSKAGSDNLCRDLLLHRLKTCTQASFEALQQYRLTSLELYVCPQLKPSIDMLASGTLRKLALPGCGLVNDATMALVAKFCKHLEILDLRACELVSDHGISLIAQNCSKLTYLNVGRVKNANGITDDSIVKISKFTAIETLGLAGCAVGDESVIAIAEQRGQRLERLSMNQCAKVSDASIRILLKASPLLQVLELVGCPQVRDALLLCEFKLRTGALVETSELMTEAMKSLEREIKRQVLCLQRGTLGHSAEHPR